MRSPDPMFDIKAQESDHIKRIDDDLVTLRAAYERVNRLVGIEADPRFVEFTKIVQEDRDRAMQTLLSAKEDREAAIMQGRVLGFDSVLSRLTKTAKHRLALAQRIQELENLRQQTVAASGRVVPQPL